MDAQFCLDLFDTSASEPEEPPTAVGTAVSAPSIGASLPPPAAGCESRPAPLPTQCRKEAGIAPAGLFPPGADGPTLQSVIEQLRCREDLLPRRRRDLISALRTVARLLGRPPAHIPAHLPDLRRALAKAGPATVDTSAKRLANVRSDVSFALRCMRPSADRPRRVTPLAEVWHKLASSCGTAAVRWRLSRFMRWCSDQGITPEEVDAAVLNRFITDMDTSTLAIEPEALRRQIVAAWAVCAGSVANWPSQVLGPPKQRRGWAIDWSEFTGELRADLEIWVSRLAGHDLLAEDGPVRPLRPATLHQHREQVRLTASALVRAGVQIGDITSLADVVSVEHVRIAVRWLLGHHGGPSDTIHKRVTILRAIARHHVKLPEPELALLSDICRRMVVPRHGLTKKNRDRLRPFDDPRRMDLLLTLPHKLMRRARSKGRPRCAAARDAQIAVAIEILLTAAPRIGNVASLCIGKHILIDAARPNRVVLTIAEDETKNESIIDQELPVESSRMVREYIDRFLPALGPPGCDCVFPGRTGGPMRPAALAKRITAAIRAETGCEVNPHLMRHLGAKGHLDEHPGEYEVVRRMLGHKSIDTTTGFYTGFESGAAARHFDAGLLARRRRAEARLGRRARGQ